MKHGMICLPMLLLMGCGGGSNPPKNDPLLGLNAPPIPKTGAGALAKGPERPLPALTAPSAETSAAALASGGVPKLDGDRNLRLDDKDPAASWRGKTGPVSLGKPDLNGEPAAPKPIDDITRAGGPGAITAGELRQLIRSLEQRGMKGFRLEQQRDSGQWRCICSIPSRNNPNTKQTYDTTAADPESAVRAVLDQVERDTR